ncbi:MAG: hypothetical protein PGN08_01775 [Sphingomonas taxi]
MGERGALGFKGMETGSNTGLGTPVTLTLADGVDDAPLSDLASSIMSARRRLGGHLDASLFANPGLDILLFLFAEGLHGATVTTNACCAAAGVPRTTALRWIKLLQDRGLIDGSDDVSDRRVTMLALTPRARETVRTWLTEIEGLPLNRSGPADR